MLQLGCFSHCLIIIVEKTAAVEMGGLRHTESIVCGKTPCQHNTLRIFLGCDSLLSRRYTVCFKFFVEIYPFLLNAVFSNSVV